MPPGTAKRILIVDDSAVMRSLLRAVLASEPAVEVSGSAGNGESALRLVEELRPDLVLLDVEMPVMDGLATLRRLRGRGHTMPVIMCSSLTQSGARVTIEALACGASDYVAKPSGQTGPAEATRVLARELLPKIAALTATEPGAISRSSQGPLVSDSGPTRNASVPATPSVLVVGVSTGGPAALDLLLPALPASFPLPVLIVQHMPELFTRLLAERLALRCPLPVREASNGDVIAPGCVAIARGNWHLEVQNRPGRPPVLRLTQGPPENHCRPAVDVLFRTAAAHYGSGVLGVVLTGMGSDGLEGCRLIRARGGTVMVQDQATSTIWGMPGAVARAGLARRILPVQEIASELIRLTGGTTIARSEIRQVVA
ncbi:MAG TPA: chemotaxis-specific protein-glutamate methyltransferase CheB [Terracidiphilus sp.]|jgi:two-component system chemotaxis response regulator CheB|nr:chemotaxis-specific protein-glutamate methyltransferase CheB [Terracidiphilus sp.]